MFSGLAGCLGLLGASRFLCDFDCVRGRSEKTVMECFVSLTEFMVGRLAALSRASQQQTQCG